MKEWLTAREMAAENLPEIPATESALIRYAVREGWVENPAYARQREGRGGGMEYNYRLLPTLAQISYCQRYMVVGSAEVMPAAAENDESTVLTSRAQLERDARLAILKAFERFSRGIAQLGLHSRLQVFTDKYNMGSLTVEPWVKDAIPHVGKRTLLTWRAAQKAGKATKLAYDPALSRKGTGVLETANGGAVKDFILSLIAFNPFLAAHDLRDQVGDRFPKLEVRGKVVAIPNERAFQRCAARLKAEHRVALTKVTNPDLYRSTMAPAGVGTYRYITEPNQLWMIDASPVDALCTDGRYSIYACVDIGTRRMTITVSRTPRASGVALMMRKAVMAWGVPIKVKTDNGSDFVANDTKRLMRFLDIEVELSQAYTPQEKGHIERAIGTFQRRVATLLPGFVGHSVTDRKAIESRKSFANRLGESEAETFGVKLTGAELQVYIDQWLDLVYQHKPHAGLKGISPFQKAAQSAAHPRMVDERALDLLLMPVAGKDGQRTTTKFGVRIDNFHFSTPDILPGTPVFVRQDPLNAGRAYAFSPDGAQFLGMAYCAELAGIDPAELQRQTRAAHAAIIDSAMKTAKAEMKELGKKPLIEAALRYAASQATNVIALPKRTTEHSTPEIVAAVIAMSEAKANPMDDSTAAEQQRMMAEYDAEEAADARVQEIVAEREAEIEAARIAHLPVNANVVALPETAKERYRRAVAFKEIVDAGGKIEFADAYWLGQFEGTPEFKGQQAVHLQFGDDYLAL